MFQAIRKHQTWLWALIIAAVIVSFVIFFTPGVGRSAVGGGAAGVGTIAGRTISRQEYLQAADEARLELYLRFRQWVDSATAQRYGIDLEREISNRLVLIETLRQWNIEVDDTTVAKWIVERFATEGQPATAPANYGAFIRNVLAPARMGEPDLQRFIRNEIGIGHLIKVTGSAGELVTPRRAERLYREQNEKMEAEAVVFSGPEFMASVELEPASLARFYTNNRGRYRIPEKVQVNYVQFAKTNYLAEADREMVDDKDLAAKIEQQYVARGPSSFMDADGRVMPPEAAKAEIREDERQRKALIAAQRAAGHFAVDLDNMSPVKAGNLVNLAAAKGLVSMTTAPFSELSRPTNVTVSSRFVRTAFQLTDEQPISPSVIEDDAVFLLSLRGKVPSSVPSMDSVRDRVTADFRRDEARRLAMAAGTNFVQVLTNGLAREETWEEICAAAEATSVSIPEFSSSTRSLPGLDGRLTLREVKDAVSGKEPGQASDLVRSRDGSFVAYLRSRTPVEDAEVEAELPRFLASLRRSQRMTAFNEWFQKQVQLTRIKTIGSGPETPSQQ